MPKKIIRTCLYTGYIMCLAFHLFKGERYIIRAAPRKYQPKSCNIKKSKILKFCQNNHYGSLIKLNISITCM